MLDTDSIDNLNLKTNLDKDSTTDDSSEGSFTFNFDYKPKTTKKQNKFYKRKASDICYALNLFEKYGNIITQELENDSFFITKIQKINFKECKDLFEKGKKDQNQTYNEAIESIPDITFWHQRYYYYSLFDEGIKMDNECWWSVTPEELAIYIATFTADKTIVDGFCGSGGNVIQFSKYGKKVYAVDIDLKKIEICKNNCQVYQCKDNIEYINSDFLKTGSFLKADFVFLSPPWGGIKYKNSDVYSIKELMTPNIYDIIRTSLEIAPKIIFFLPRTLDIYELCEIIQTILKERGIEPKTIFFDIHVLKSASKIKALMIIFGLNQEEIYGNDIKEYISNNYSFISHKTYNTLVNIAKTVGFYDFIKGEAKFKSKLNSEENKSFCKKSNYCYADSMIDYFLTDVLSDQKKVELKKLEITKNKINSKRFKKPSKV